MAARSTGRFAGKGKTQRPLPSLCHAGAVGFLCILVACGAGCSAFKKAAELTAEDNFVQGMKEFEDENYQRAIPYFQKILENYPFSIHALPAELKIAECNFLDEKYTEALVHLQGFEELHPTNEQIPYVIWMKGVSYMEQFSSIDRDVLPLENALREFEKLRQRFPESSYSAKAEPLHRDIRQKLSEHDFYVAQFYYRDGKFRAALPRFQRILERFPEEGIADKALYFIGKCHFFLEKNDQSREAFEELLRTYPNSPYREGAQEFLADLAEGRFTVVSRYFRAKERVFGWLGYE